MYSAALTWKTTWLRISPQTGQHTATVFAQLARTHPHCSHSVQLVAGIEEGIRQMMEIPSCSSNSHPTPPLLRLRVFTPLIDSLSQFPFQESLSRLSTQLTFPRTPSSSRCPGSWAPWAAFPQRSLDLYVDMGPLNGVGGSKEDLWNSSNMYHATEMYLERCFLY